MMIQFDCNQDGVISFDEYLKGVLGKDWVFCVNPAEGELWGPRFEALGKKWCEDADAPHMGQNSTEEWIWTNENKNGRTLI